MGGNTSKSDTLDNQNIKELQKLKNEMNTLV